MYSVSYVSNVEKLNEKTTNTKSVGTFPKSSIKIVERCKIDTRNTQIHDV